MNKTLILMAFLLNLGIPIYALPIVANVQNNTYCDGFGYCEATINMGKFLALKDIDSLRSLDLTKYTPVKSCLKYLNTTWLNLSTLKVYGEVTDNCYWVMDLGKISIDPWFNKTWMNRTNFTITNSIVGYKGFPITVNVSSLAGYRCGSERWLNSAGYSMRFWRETCNSSATANITWFVMLNDTGTANISLYTNNTSAVTDSSECNTNSLVFCDDFEDGVTTGWITRVGGGTGTITAQSGFTYNSSYGWNITNPTNWVQAYTTSGLSTSETVIQRIIWYLYNYSTAQTTHYFGLCDSLFACDITMRVPSTGNLQNYAWTNIAGLFFVKDKYQKVIVDFNTSAQKMNVTIQNGTGSYKSVNLAMADKTAPKQQVLLMGTDTTNWPVFGDTVLIADYTNPEPTYSQLSGEGYDLSLETSYVTSPIVVCFTIKDVCVKLDDFTIYVNNDKGWMEL